MVDPEVRGDAKEPCARVRGFAPQLTERHEGARQRILRQIFGIPRATGEIAAVSIKVWAEGLVDIEEPMPGDLNGTG